MNESKRTGIVYKPAENHPAWSSLLARCGLVYAAFLAAVVMARTLL